MKKDMTTVVGIAQFTAKEGKHEELLKELYSLTVPTRKEPGCINYKIHESVNDPKVITFVEKFTNKNAFEEHCKQPYIVNLAKNIMPNLVASSSVSLHQEII